MTTVSSTADDPLRVERTMRTLRELALERLRDGILDFQFKPGERLVERTLCERLGVSRTVVREVLRHLETEGLVEVVRQQGPAVAQPDASEAAQVYGIRGLLEAEAARAAAANAKPSDVARLRRANASIQAAFANGTRRDVLRATTDFYEILFSIAGKGVAWQVVQGLNARINQLRAMTIAHPGRSGDANAEMNSIIDAIAAQDGDLAASASVAHVNRVKALALRALQDAASARPVLTPPAKSTRGRP